MQVSDIVIQVNTLDISLNPSSFNSSSSGYSYFIEIEKLLSLQRLQLKSLSLTLFLLIILKVLSSSQLASQPSIQLLNILIKRPHFKHFALNDIESLSPLKYVPRIIFFSISPL